MSDDIITKINLAEHGKIFKREEVNRKLNVLRKRVSKWATLTDKYQFKEGDVYILPNIAKEINSFRTYVKSEFNLSISMYPLEKGDTVAVEIIKFKKKKRK